MSGPNFIGGPIWTHDKRGGDVIMAGIRQYEGNRFLDVRLWTNGGETPTCKGATIPRDAVASFVVALTAWSAANAPDGPENGS